jgi:hypothetical protein
MRKLALILALFTLTAQASTPTTAEVKVAWQHPEKYTDIRPSNGTKAAYQKQVIKAFDKIWADFASKLPAGYRLEVTVKDLDLAGDVNPMFRIDHNDIRVIKDIYFPRMNFDYVLFDANKQQIAAGQDEKIKDMGFMMSTPSGFNQREFAYEAEMLKKWFKKTISPKLPAVTQ